MNLAKSSCVELATTIAQGETPDGVDVVLCPPFPYLDLVVTAVSGSKVAVGAQDAYFEESGAFTGEVSCDMLNDVGCQFVILGHSERRNVIGECNQQINKKVKAALAKGLSPILCVGELLAEREAGDTLKVVQEQFEGSLADVTAEQMQHVVLAYEPVWAIGTGKTATPEQAQEVHADLRKLLANCFNDEISQNVPILYGGSVKPANAEQLLSQADIDGALVGGASLKSDSFLQIIAAGQTKSAV